MLNEWPTAARVYLKSCSHADLTKPCSTSGRSLKDQGRELVRRQCCRLALFFVPPPTLQALVAIAAFGVTASCSQHSSERSRGHPDSQWLRASPWFGGRHSERVDTEQRFLDSQAPSWADSAPAQQSCLCCPLSSPPLVSHCLPTSSPPRTYMCVRASASLSRFCAYERLTGSLLRIEAHHEY